MGIARTWLAPLVITLLVACKGSEGSSGSGSGGTTKDTPAKGPLITKPYDQLVIADLAAAVTSAGWKPGQTSNSSSGPLSNIMQTAQKPGDTKQLTVAVFKMPAANVAQWPASHSDYVYDVQGSSVLAVKLYPADPDGAKKVLSQLTGK